MNYRHLVYSFTSYVLLPPIFVSWPWKLILGTSTRNEFFGSLVSVKSRPHSQTGDGANEANGIGTRAWEVEFERVASVGRLLLSRLISHVLVPRKVLVCSQGCS